MSKVKVMLAGIGGYGMTYVNRLLPLSDNGKIEFVGIVEPYPQVCPKLAEIQSRNIPIYATLAEFYAEKTCDLACIAVPIQFHTEMIIEAMSHGSHVLCEKPLSGDVNDIEKLIASREKYGKFVMIGYQWSHSEAIQAMKRDVLAGVYGKPKFLKSIVLWPRNQAYFRRGSGWAGKIKAADGTPILDSVAHNATAHYLHNMFYTMGASFDDSLTPIHTEAHLYRTNPIENFDTALISCEFENGAKTLFIASHSTDKKTDPIFEYRFENGTISFEEGTDRRIIGKTADGKVYDYGDPFADQARKINIAIQNVSVDKPYIPCGIEAASAELRCIGECAKLPIINFPEEKKHIDANGVVCVNGLYENLWNCYSQEVIESF